MSCKLCGFDKASYIKLRPVFLEMYFFQNWLTLLLDDIKYNINVIRFSNSSYRNLDHQYVYTSMN